MDDPDRYNPAKFGLSTVPLEHEPYGPIKPERLVGANKGKVAVVTGAGRGTFSADIIGELGQAADIKTGIGRAIALALANSGANLALLDLSLDRQQETKTACQDFDGVKVEAFQCDITNIQAVRDTFAAITKTLGPVDILVNNAGVAYGKLAFQETFEQFWKAIEVNFKGSMACIYEVLPGMRERKSGCIISMASRAATVDMAGGLSYNSSKAAIARATSTLQEEFEVEGLGDKVHTYCLHPGAVWGALVTGKTALPVLTFPGTSIVLFTVRVVWEREICADSCGRKYNARSARANQADFQGCSGTMRQHGNVPCFRTSKGVAWTLFRLQA